MSLGLCVKPGRIPSPQQLEQLHPSFLRSILYRDEDLEELKRAGKRLWLTVNNEWGRFNSWNVEDAAQYLADNADGLIWRVSWGNEFDTYWKNNPGDVPPVFAADLVNRAQPILREAGIETWSTSVAGERWTDYLREMIPLCRDKLDGADFHGYGQRPNGFHEERQWYFGDMRDCIGFIRSLGVNAGGTEYGVTVNDAGGEDEQAFWIQCAYETALALGIDLAYFSFHDSIGRSDEQWDNGHGLIRPDDTRRPAYATYCALPEQAVPGPVPPTPVEPPAVIVHGSDPWQFWSSTTLADILGAPEVNVREYFPKVVEQFDHIGVSNDRAVWASAAGNIRIETGGPDASLRFSPVREAYWLSEAWRAANLRYYPAYGRGLMQCTWPENYEAYGQAIDDLWQAGGAIIRAIRENYDAMLDGDVSSAFIAVYWRDHGDLIGASRIGDMQEVRRLVQGGSAGLQDLWGYWNALMPAEVTPQPILLDKTVLDAAIALGKSRIGDAYVFGGKVPGAIDCSGFFYWALNMAGVQFPQPIGWMNTDALFHACTEIDEADAYPGDGIFYEYNDPGQPGIRFPHMGFWTGPGTTLEARFPNGVHEYVTLNKPYRIARAPGVSVEGGSPPTVDERKKLINAVGYLTGDIPARLDRNAAGLALPPLPKAEKKMLKADWKKAREDLEQIIHPHYAEDEAIKDEMLRVGRETL
jgi:hypothetical protein